MSVKHRFATITASEKQALAVTTGLLLLLAAWFLRDYLVTIVIAVILAYLFSPLYKRFQKRMSNGWAATATFFSALAIIIVPLALAIGLAVVQVTGLVGQSIHYFQNANLQELGTSSLNSINDLLAKVPYTETRLTQDDIRNGLTQASQAVGNWLPGFLQSSASGLFETITLAVIFIYLFFSLLIKQDKVLSIFRHLNPLGDEVSDLYLQKAGSMVKASVRGQFIIALLQGLSGILSLYLAGFHQAMFVLLIIFTLLALIPLGSGVLAIPFGLGLMAFGNVTGGLLVIIWHFVVTSTVDNVMRPVLVPKEAQLDPALVMLSVFAGIAMFGLIGIVIGPVFMILVTTTIDTYRTVYYGVPIDTEPAAKPRQPGRLVRWYRLLRRKLPV